MTPLKPYGNDAGNAGGIVASSTVLLRNRQQKNKGLFFVGTVAAILTTQYVSYTILLLTPLVYPNYTTSGLISMTLFNILFALILIAYVKCIVTDPGAIPRHWAFYRGDVAKRRRYCKECNAWKPDRTHHCSACARCVLNMDHHCPWINNCVGFYNRKFFIQLLVYCVVALGMITIHAIVYIGALLRERLFCNISPFHNFTDVLRLIVTIMLLGVSSFLWLAMMQFTSFHIRLVAANLTTIENLDYSAREASKYDLGVQRNCQQVFGPTLMLWWIPKHTNHSKPVGDGVRWIKRMDSMVDDV